MTLPSPISSSLSLSTTAAPRPSTTSLISIDTPQLSFNSASRTFETVTLADGALRFGDVNVFVIQSGTVEHARTIMLMPQRLVLEIIGFTGHGRDFSIFRTIFLPGFHRHGFHQPPFLLIPHFVGFPLTIPRDLRWDLIWDKSRAFFLQVCSSFQLQVRVDITTLKSPLEGSSVCFDPVDRWYQAPLVDELPELEFGDLMVKAWVRAFQDAGGVLRMGPNGATLVEGQ